MLPNPALIRAVTSAARMAAGRRRGLAVAATWRAQPDVVALADALRALSEDPPHNVAAMGDRFGRWLDDIGWLDALIARCSAAIRADPFTAFPFRPAHGQVVDSLSLLQTADADIALCWIDGRTLAGVQERTIMFSDSWSVIRPIRANGLLVQPYRRTPAGDAATALPCFALVDEGRLAVDHRDEHVAMRCAQGDAVLLRVHVLLAGAGLRHVHDAATGRLCGTAMGDDRVSRMLPLLCVARLAGQAGRAAAALQDCARDPDPLLRWAAMREWLVADPRAARAALPAVAAADPDRAVRKAALATLQLLMHRESPPCPA